jgi:hypothetical protein
VSELVQPRRIGLATAYPFGNTLNVGGSKLPVRNGRAAIKAGSNIPVFIRGAAGNAQLFAVAPQAADVDGHGDRLSQARQQHKARSPH